MSFESLVEARLTLGEHHELVARIEGLVAEFPLRERLWGQLMTALYRAGRQADALRAYQRLRALLGDELGLEPAAELVSLESAILLQKPELDWQESSLIKICGNRPRSGTRGNETRLLGAPSTPQCSARREPGRPRDRDAGDLECNQTCRWGRGARGILISGEAGQGKTALVAEAARSAIRDGA